MHNIDTPRPAITPSPFLTVEQTAAILGIGRSLAYELVSRYERTQGREGIACIRFGRLIRVPRTVIDDLMNVHTPSTPAAS